VFAAENYDLGTDLCYTSSFKEAFGSEKIRLRYLCSGNHISRVISRDVIRGSRTTTSIIASSSVRVRTVRARSEFLSVVHVILLVSLWSSSICLNMLSSGWRRRRKHSAYSRASVLDRLLQTARDRFVSQYSFCVYFLNIWSTFWLASFFLLQI
jgi:hypothetical protein